MNQTPDGLYRISWSQYQLFQYSELGGPGQGHRTKKERRDRFPTHLHNQLSINWLTDLFDAHDLDGLEHGLPGGVGLAGAFAEEVDELVTNGQYAPVEDEPKKAVK